MPATRPYNDEQLRALVNLRQKYEVWRDAEREWRALPYDLRRKTVGGRDYLYEIADRSGNGKSLGAWDDEKQQQFDAYRELKASLKDRRKRSAAALDQSGRLARAAGVPQVSSAIGPILREADLRGLLDGSLLVVGTNAVPGYAQEAAGRIVGAADETEDFDLAWAAEEQPDGAPVWSVLKAVDPTFTVNTEREFQARNADAYEVELLAAPSRFATLGRLEKPRPIPLPEQEWLLPGRWIDQIVPCRDASAVRIVAPDPRWFALQKIWLSQQAKRNPFKRGKDRDQGNAILDAVAEAMPHYPLDAAFRSELPDELAPLFRAWEQARCRRSLMASTPASKTGQAPIPKSWSPPLMPAVSRWR